MSQVIPVGVSASACGYCKAAGRTSVVEGLVAPSLAVGEYQWLVDARWRRCGEYFYRPVLAATCCQLQSIRYQTAGGAGRGASLCLPVDARLDVRELALSRSQRKCLRRLAHAAHLPPSALQDLAALPRNAYASVRAR